MRAALASIALWATLAGPAWAAPQVEVRAESQLALSRVRLEDSGKVEVTGQLTDKITGDPLAGKRVRVTVGGETEGTFTQADGSFRVELPARPGPQQVRLEFPGGERLEAADPVEVTTDPSKAQVELALVKAGDEVTGARVRVTATVDDAPVRVPVTIAIAPIDRVRMRDLHTLPSGDELVITRADAGGPGLYRVRATFTGDATRQRATTEATLALTAGTTTTMDVPNTHPAYDDALVATGQVTDDDHQPVAHAAVTLTTGDKRLAQGATGADGRYRLEVEAERVGRGDHQIQVQADPGSSYLRPSRSPPRQVHVAEPQPVPVSYTVAAFVATLIAAGGFFLARTRPWRRLRRPPPPAEVPAHEPAAEPAEGGLVLARPGLVSTLRRPSDDGFSGVVRDTVRGRPVADAVVRVVLAGGEREVRTGADGAFAIEELPAGEWRAEVAAPGHVSETFALAIPHRGELRGVRVDLVPVRERVFQLYRRAAEPVLPEPRLWGIWSPRQIVDHVRARRPSPALAELTDFVEEVYFSPRVTAEAVLPHAAERVDRAIHERTRRGI